MLCSNSTWMGRQQTLSLVIRLSLKNSTSLFISNYFPVKAALGKEVMGHLLGMENSYNYAKLGEKRSPFIAEQL